MQAVASFASYPCKVSGLAPRSSSLQYRQSGFLRETTSLSRLPGRTRSRAPMQADKGTVRAMGGGPLEGMLPSNMPNPIDAGKSLFRDATEKVKSLSPEKLGKAGGGEKYVEPNERLTTAAGRPVGENQNSVTAGMRGPILMQDFHLFEKNAHFNRERIPPRVVHEKGTGAHGIFTVTHDVTKYTKAKIFESVGKKTPLFVRLSPVSGSHDAADSVRDVRGFAVKFYTEEGNWDLVGNNTPIFFIRDPLKFPDFIHTQKRDPRTGAKSWTNRWDFWGLSPESVHQVLWLFGDRGIPKSYRHMNGYGSHAFSMINDQDERVWVKFHWKTQQGIHNWEEQEAMKIAGEDPDYYNLDLFKAIEDRNFPKWTLYIQVMTEEQADDLSFDPFDLTKTWPHSEFPLMPVGEIELNRNPLNYFEEVEQATFAPGNVIPGISWSPDRILQARVIAYKDAHNYRVGINADHLPVNRPKVPAQTYHRDGFMRADGNGGTNPDYEPNSFGGPREDPRYRDDVPAMPVTGPGYRYNHREFSDDFTQAGVFWRMLKEDEKQRLVTNISNTMKGVGAGLRSDPVPRRIQEINVFNFFRVDADLGQRLADSLELSLHDVVEERSKELEHEVPAPPKHAPVPGKAEKDAAKSAQAGA